MKIKTWISALRLRTLPLATAAILMGSFLADIYMQASWTILFLSLLTAISLQILSNLANDYGDFTKGTDNEKRLGNTRALQSGHVTSNQMKWAILVTVFICLCSGICLLYFASDNHFSSAYLILFLIGLAAILAAIKYTMGKNPYGYSGFGDVFVFIFFGPVAVIGSYSLQTHFEFDLVTNYAVLLPAIGIGVLCMGVINTNNIRDIENDKTSGKHTIPVRIGLTNAKRYHVVMIVFAILCFTIFNCLAPLSPFVWITIFAFFPLLSQARKVYNWNPSAAFNSLLKQLSLSTLLLVICYILSEVIGRNLLIFIN